MNHRLQSSQPFPGSMLPVTPSPRSVLSCFCIQALGAGVSWHSELPNITRSAALHTMNRTNFFSARDFSVILVLLKALNPVNKPHPMHWASVVQQDFFIWTCRRNSRLEGHSCPKKYWTSLQFQQFYVNGNYLFSSKALPIFKKRLEQKKKITDF